MANRLTNINLREWALSPTRWYTPQTAAQTMQDGDILTLRRDGTATFFDDSAGTTVPVFGGLPTVAVTDDAPYYHMLVYPIITGPGIGPTPRFRVRTQDGEFLGLTVYGSTSAYSVGQAYYRIPHDTEAVEIEMVNDASGTTVAVTYVFAVPTAPINSLGERLSVLSQEDWANAPLRRALQQESAYATLDGFLSLPLPTEDDLAGAPFYYFCAEFVPDSSFVTLGGVEVRINDTAITTLRYLNGSTIFVPVAEAPETFRPALNLFATSGWTYPTLGQLSARATTSLEVAAPADGTFYWHFAIPQIPVL